MKLSVSFQPQTVEISVNPSTMGVTMGAPVARDYVERDPYSGDYEITPSSEVQTLQTNGKRMTADVVINPIPQNYGLITWNGSFLTVS